MSLVDLGAPAAVLGVDSGCHDRGFGAHIASFARRRGLRACGRQNILRRFRGRRLERSCHCCGLRLPRRIRRRLGGRRWRRRLLSIATLFRRFGARGLQNFQRWRASSPSFNSPQSQSSRNGSPSDVRAARATAFGLAPVLRILSSLAQAVYRSEPVANSFPRSKNGGIWRFPSGEKPRFLIRRHGSVSSTSANPWGTLLRLVSPIHSLQNRLKW